MCGCIIRESAHLQKRLAVRRLLRFWLLNDIQSLKPVPGDANAVYNCPSDDGITYTFAFRNPGLNATAAASSCEWVTISGKTYLSTDKFWHDVTKATGQSI